MKITTLMENTACRPELAAEHGLSLYIETEGYRILFDAGPSGAFADNAQILGIDLRQTDFAVLSHGHYDHGGGLARFRECCPEAAVYASQYAFEPHYNARNAFIGLDPAFANDCRMVPVAGTYPLAPGITLLTLPCGPADTAGLQMESNGQLLPEDFRHEQYLLIEEQGKRILFSGCSHKGIVQIAAAFRPDVLVGGFHFMKEERESVLRQAAQALLSLPTVYYTGHCTGQTQYQLLKTILGERLHYCAAGSVVVL